VPPRRRAPGQGEDSKKIGFVKIDMQFAIERRAGPFNIGDIEELPIGAAGKPVPIVSRTIERAPSNCGSLARALGGKNSPDGYLRLPVRSPIAVADGDLWPVEITVPRARPYAAGKRLGWVISNSTEHPDRPDAVGVTTPEKEGLAG